MSNTSSQVSAASTDVPSLIAQRLIQEYGAWEAPKIAAAIFEETVKEIEQDLGTQDLSQAAAQQTSSLQYQIRP